ncbi:MAG: DNA polymerase III subunit beta [Candidatus Magnetobacterium sp. LHC-1]|uniref:Beta sliding clamp n=1 Tax=Candidatus Magnetobacterium casense TaxID=1455061 RepID=A0ABS6RVN7_9BACT|nr:DNA polymerase III subunit beta [Candidatus Magnetobacterium casensis]MBF0607723.1 DNA polymerase III subunit beta [Nitrospirota bacterium]MBV6340693.1 DNA polymerase III subunit beta [Candidatus Magnetobacterium casensis]
MKIVINRQEIHDKLADIQGIVEKKTTLPIVNNFLLTLGTQKGEIYATDLEVALKEPINIEGIQEDVTLCLPGRRLFDISREVEDDLELEYDGQGWVKLKSGKSLFRIACMNPDDYPVWPKLSNKKTITIHSETLLSMFEKTIYCAGENDPRYAFNGVLLHLIGSRKKLCIVGTDGHRLAIVSRDMDVDFEDEIKVIVPKKAVIELKKILATIDEDVVIDITKNHLLFYLHDKEFLTRLIDGAYPNYEQVIPVNNDKMVVIDREELVKCLRRILVISRDKTRVMKVDIENNVFAVSVSDPEIGEAKDSVIVQYEAKPITMGLNAKFLLDTLLSMQSPTVSMELLDTLNPTLFKEEGSDDYRCVLMPIRI